MSEQIPLCPECGSEHAYPMGALLVCPMCGHEWAPGDSAEAGSTGGDGPRVITDAVGNVLADGDTVTVIKDLKVKGSSTWADAAEVERGQEGLKPDRRPRPPAARPLAPPPACDEVSGGRWCCSGNTDRCH